MAGREVGEGAGGPQDLVLGRVTSSAVPGATGERLVLDGAQVSGEASVSGGTTVGRDAEVRAHAVVQGSVIFDDAVIGERAVVRGSVIGRGAVIGADAVIESAVIGDGARIGDANELLAGIRVFPEVELPPRGVRFSSDQSSS